MVVAGFAKIDTSARCVVLEREADTAGLLLEPSAVQMVGFVPAVKPRD